MKSKHQRDVLIDMLEGLITQFNEAQDQACRAYQFHWDSWFIRARGHRRAKVILREIEKIRQQLEYD